MHNPEATGVRISRAAPEADLAAVVWPGVAAIYYPGAESVDEIRAADALITRLERLRGIRRGSIELRPLVESAIGVARAAELAASSTRIRAFGVGPRIEFALDGDALAYARLECELHARALGHEVLDIQYVLD
jgi:citrate lyase subunit beta/citryl-CoA lyase